MLSSGRLSTARCVSDGIGVGGDVFVRVQHKTGIIL